MPVIIYESWHTRGDMRVCGPCQALHGQEWRQGEGPQPPLHPGCRCRRRQSRVVWAPEPVAPPPPPPAGGRRRTGRPGGQS